MGYGSMVLDRNGHRVIGHMGNAVGTMTSMSLLPDDHVGLFVSYNGDRARPLTGEAGTLNAFLDHFFPVPPTILKAPTDFNSRTREFTVVYRRNNFGGSVTSIEKLSRLTGASNRTISAPGDGTLQVT